MSKIVWLSSYPKSGNTWTRAFLTAYQNSENKLGNLGGLIGGMGHATTEIVEDWAAVSATEMTLEQLLRLRARFVTSTALENPAPHFQKIHDQYETADGTLIFPPPDITRGVVYLVRNPLDVAVSFASFVDYELPRTIRLLNADWTQLARLTSISQTQLPQRISSWRGHVHGWTEGSILPTLVVRYEDLVRDPIRWFRKIILFSGLSLDETRLLKAEEATRFDALKSHDQNSEIKLARKSQTGFFRKGRVGTWQTELTDKQRDYIIAHQTDMMIKFGYLDNNGYLTADALGED